MTRLLLVMIKDGSKDFRFRLRFQVDINGLVLREFLQQKGISKRTLTATKYQGGKLTVNGVERTVRHLLVMGDEVEVFFPLEKTSDGLAVEDGEIDIIYEDEAILLINKPAGQSTIPSRDHPSATIANFVAGKFAKEQIPATVHVVTRLDYDTSGLICIAKNRHIHHLLSQEMMNSSFQRRYEAIVEGYLKEDKMTIEAPIGRKDGSIIERVVRHDGQYARTDVQVIERLQLKGRQLTRVALDLHTGRTHQIRVHMQWIGHVLVGDDLYGGHKDLMSRQALHCARLKFNHPLTGESKEFRSTIPDDMSRALELNQRP